MMPGNHFALVNNESKRLKQLEVPGGKKVILPLMEMLWMTNKKIKAHISRSATNFYLWLE